MNGGARSQRDVRLIVAAVGVSAMGDFMLWIPLTLHLQSMTESGIAVAALMICLFAPSVLLAPVTGLLVDRGDARKLLIGASLVQAAIAAGLALALDSVAAILILAAALGVGFAVAQPSEFSLIPVIGRGRDLTTVNGWVETARYGGMSVGPAIGGALAAGGGTEVAMLVNAATFLVVAAAGVLLRARRQGIVANEDGPERARDGFVYLMRDRTLRISIGVVFVSLLFMSATIAAEVFFLKQDLGVDDALYGLLFSAWTLGMVIGAVFVAKRVAPLGLALMTLVAVGVQGLGIGLPAALVAAGFTGAMWFVGGLGHGVKNVLARTLIQERVPDRLHGRAFAAYNGARNGAELLAIAAGGVLVAAIGARTTLALAGGLALLAAVVGIALYRRSGESPAPADFSDRAAEAPADADPFVVPSGATGE